MALADGTGKGDVLITVCDEREGRMICREIEALGERAVYFPEIDYQFFRVDTKSKEILRSRTQVLADLTAEHSDSGRIVVVTTIGALMGPVLAPGMIAEKLTTLKTDDEMEIGMGQHGEGGGGVMKMQTANETAKIMVERLVAATKLQSGDRALLIIHGSGATTAMEMLICYRAAAKVLMGMGISLVDGLATELLTVQEMAGFQMTLAKVTPETDALLKAKSNAPYWVCNG
jgi:dihydroxyacetone kinase-like protein